MPEVHASYLAAHAYHSRLLMFLGVKRGINDRALTGYPAAFGCPATLRRPHRACSVPYAYFLPAGSENPAP
jgi:hypothetical protein